MKTTKPLNAYFAHSMRKYDTLAEAEERSYIESIFPGTVVCPNKQLGELGSMLEYLKVVSTVSAVYATEYCNYIGK